MSFLDCIKTRIDDDEVLSKSLYSLILFGSYVRGDFIEEVSDLDFFAVFNDHFESSIPSLRVILEECASSVKYKLIDLPHVGRSELQDPLKQKHPLKFLTFYQEDFLKYHKIVFGHDISSIIPSYDKETLLYTRAKQLLEAPKRFKDDLELLKVSAGEVVRFEAIVSGSNSISKVDILNTLEKIGDKEAIDIFTAYIEGKDVSFSKEYLSSFIVSRISKFLENRS